MNISIPQEVIELVKATARNQSVNSLAKEIGITQATLNRWIQPDGVPGMPSSKNVSALIAWYESKTLRRIPKSEPTVFIDVPILGSAQAAGFEPALEAWDAWLEGQGDGVAQFAGAKHGWFALKVEGDSMTPDYPAGTLLLVAAGEFPQRGDIVVARIAGEGQVVVKEYHRKNGVVELVSINPTGRNYTWNVKENPGYVVWMWPVVRAEIDLRKRRWEETRSGGC